MKKYITIVIVLSLIEIGLALYLTEWRHAFWDFVNNKQIKGFTTQLAIFTVVALVLCFVSACSSYAGNLAAIKWREKLNSQLFVVRESRIENINQRIQEDCREYPSLLINLMCGFGKSIVYIFVFSIFLVCSFSALYLIYILAYSIIGTLVARKIAMPLIKLNYESQKVEATYRNNLEIGNFNDCIRIMFGVAKKTKHLNYFQTFYGQVAVIIPIIIVAPDYFLGAMTIGALMQTTSIMSTILDNLSFGVNSFDSMNRFLSCRKRLKEIRKLP